LGFELGLELLPCGALLRKVLCGCQRGLLRSAIGNLLRSQLSTTFSGPLFQDSLFLGPQFLGTLFLCPLFPGPLFLCSLFLGLQFLGPQFLRLPFGSFRGLLCGEFGSYSRCLPRGLLCFQTCDLLRGRFRSPACLFFRGQLRGALTIAGGRLSGKLRLPHLLMLASLHDRQIFFFRHLP